MTDSALRRLAAAVAVVALAAPLTACATTTISKILAEPYKYREDDVGLKGDVVESLSLLGHGAYKLDDGTGTIWIVSRHGVPRRGARVKVTGRIRDVVDVSSIFKLPDEIGSGLVMVEDRHKGF